MEKTALENKVEQLLIETGAWLTGHFKLTSGRHSGNYMQCAMLLRHPRNAQFLGQELAKKLVQFKPDFVTAPAIGGLVIGYEVARALDVPFLFCEREKTGEMRLRRFPVPENKKFVVVEDVITTGGSVLETAQHLESVGGQWLATGCVVNRSGGKAQLKYLQQLVNLEFPTYSAEECPLCVELGTEPIKPGSR